MDCRLLTGDQLDLSHYHFGAPQQAGCLTVMPIVTQYNTEPFQIPGETDGEDANIAGISIPRDMGDGRRILMPLHLEVPLEKKSRTQSRVELLPYGGDHFDLAQCSVLPLLWRQHLWTTDSDPKATHFLPELRAFEARRRQLGLRQSRVANVHPCIPQLQRLSRQIERVAGQTGALFFIDDQPVGLEIAPSSAYFTALWKPLLRCYGLTALVHESERPATNVLAVPFSVSRLGELRTEMFRCRHQYQERLEATVAAPPSGPVVIVDLIDYRKYRSRSLTSPDFAGQYVEEVTLIKAKGADGHGTMPRMLRNLFRKSPPLEEPTRGRAVYVSLFAFNRAT